MQYKRCTGGGYTRTSGGAATGCDCAPCLAPTVAIVTLSDIIQCACISEMDLSSRSRSSFASVLDVSFPIPMIFQFGSTSAFGVVMFVNVGTYTDFVNSDCTGPVSNGTGSLSINAGWNSNVSLVQVVANYNPVPSRNVTDYIFSQNAFSAGSPYTTYTLPNSLTACANENLVAQAFIGFNGNATLQFLCVTSSLSPTSSNFTNAGGTGSTNITMTNGKLWFAWKYNANTSTAVLGTGVDTEGHDALDDLQITSATSGSGNGTLTYSVAANGTGVSRTFFLIVNDQTFTIHQAA